MLCQEREKKEKLEQDQLGFQLKLAEQVHKTVADAQKSELEEKRHQAEKRALQAQVAQQEKDLIIITNNVKARLELQAALQAEKDKSAAELRAERDKSASLVQAERERLQSERDRSASLVQAERERLFSVLTSETQYNRQKEIFSLMTSIGQQPGQPASGPASASGPAPAYVPAPTAIPMHMLLGLFSGAAPVPAPTNLLITSGETKKPKKPKKSKKSKKSKKHKKHKKYRVENKEPSDNDSSSSSSSSSSSENVMD